MCGNLELMAKEAGVSQPPQVYTERSESRYTDSKGTEYVLVLDSRYVYVPWDDGDGWKCPAELHVTWGGGAGFSIAMEHASKLVVPADAKAWISSQEDKANEFLLRHREAKMADALAVALRQCRDYLSGIPESAAGGDDEAMRLTRSTSELLDNFAFWTGVR